MNNTKKEKPKMTAKEVAQGITGIIVMFFFLLVALVACTPTPEQPTEEVNKAVETVQVESNEELKEVTVEEIFANDKLIQFIKSNNPEFLNRVADLHYAKLPKSEYPLLIVDLYNASFLNDNQFPNNAIADIEYLLMAHKAVGYDKGIHLMHYGLQGYSNTSQTGAISYNKETIDTLKIEDIIGLDHKNLADSAYMLEKVRFDPFQK